jgi:hypothetical protein
MHAHVQRLVSVVKMATVPEEYITEEQRFAVRFLWTKILNAKDIHKEMFHAYGGKCLRGEEVHNWVKKFSQGHSKVTDETRPGHPIEIVQKQLCSGWKK